MIAAALLASFNIIQLIVSSPSREIMNYFLFYWYPLIAPYTNSEGPSRKVIGDRYVRNYYERDFIFCFPSTAHHQKNIPEYCSVLDKEMAPP